MSSHRIFCLCAVLACIGTVLAQESAIPEGTDAYERQVQGLQSGPRTSPFEPPEASDVAFITDAAPYLDTGCIFRSSGPIVFNIEVTRHLGPTHPDGTLMDAATLVGAGLLSATATLSMPGYDVDSGAVLTPPYQPEIDRVWFNGEEIGFLSGENNVWKQNSFDIPIEKVRFAAKAAFGAAPAPAMNEIRIDIDEGNAPLGQELWCTAIDWGALTFKAASPVVLIHGNNSDGGFFDRQGFTAGLQNAHLLVDGCGACDHPINMATSPVRTNGQTLATEIPGIVKSFGVDSIHLVVHSKGGLDTREYLANHHPGHSSDFEVLSFTSLSSPHNGSAGADLLVAREVAARQADKIEYVGFPSFTRQLAALLGVDAGTLNLTTTYTAGFNSGNLRRLPRSTVYSTVAADGDRNGSSSIDTAVEIAALLPESSSLSNINSVSSSAAIGIIDRIYQILRNTRTVTVAYRTEPGFLGIGTRTIATITSVPNATPLGNDTLVTIPSGHGTGSLSGLVTNTATLTGANGRNHSDVADAGVAARVVPWILAVERANGDLK